ncbi:MAG: VOC family protein [Limnochordales bacterium]
MVIGTWHFSFTVRNLERSLEFYQGLLGMELVHRQEQGGGYTDRLVGMQDVWLKAAMLKFPGQDAGVSGHVLELIEYVRPQGTPVDLRTCNPGVAHMAFVVEDIHKEYERLKAHGVQFKSEPVAITGGRNKGGWAVYLLDPDGITPELFQPPPR